MAEHVSTLKDCFSGVFAYVLAVKRRCADEQPAYDEVRGRIMALLESSATKVRELQVDPRDYDDARFAVCAWIDETIMDMPWVHRDQWQRTLLQSELYGSANAGEEFFDRLNQLTDVQNGVREVYYYCLSLGFTGRFCHEGDDMLLEQLKRATLKQLTGSVVGAEYYSHHPMFVSAYPGGDASSPDAAANGSSTGGKLWLVMVPPVLLLSVFAVYTFVLTGVMDNVMARVAGG